MQTDLVTGAYGYTGAYLRRGLEAAGHTVRTLTGHAPADADIPVFPYRFDDPAALDAAFAGVTTFYNTYWARYSPGGTSHEQAVANTAALLRAAARAGVERVVHISITNPDADSFYAYYRGKAAVEDLVADSGMTYAVVRPGGIFGGRDILINNIAWLLRRFPEFGIPGDGAYRLRPVHVEDLADLCVRLGKEDQDVVVDAVGPEWFTFQNQVATVAGAIGRPFRPVHLPPAAVGQFRRGLSLQVRD